MGTQTSIYTIYWKPTKDKISYHGPVDYLMQVNPVTLPTMVTAARKESISHR